MFNVEQSIGEWRRKMIASGIQTPVPLEELEGHLREDVGRQMQLGVDAEQAFHKAVAGIGSGENLEQEFAKVQGLEKMRTREALRRWSVIAGTAFVYAVLATVWFIGARQRTIEITGIEIALAVGAMVPMIGLGWMGRSLAKFLPVSNRGVIFVAAFGVILLGAASLRLFWDAITPGNLVHTQIIMLWSLSPFLGIGNCLSAWADNCPAKRRELKISY